MSRARCRRWCSTSPIRWCPTRSPTSARASAPCWSSRRARPTTSSRRSTSELRTRRHQTRKIYGKDVLPMAGEYTAEVVTDGLLKFFAARRQRHRRLRPARALRGSARRRAPRRSKHPRRAVAAAAAELLHRLSRAAGVLRDQAARSARSARSISRATSAATRSRPSRRSIIGNSILGYGMSLAAAARGGAESCRSAPISIMGDGGFWHNGLITGVASQPVQQGRRRADHHAERLHLGDRRSSSCRRRGQAAGDGADRHGHRPRR